MLMKNKKINAVSLFASGGIGEFYLEDIGVEVKVANELLVDRANFYQFLYPDSKMIAGDITDKNVYQTVINEAISKECKLLIATPPCQGMSVAGKMDRNDPRNTLIISAIDAILDTDVDYALIENVPGMLNFSILVNGKPIKIVDYITERLVPKYNISFQVVNAADYGTPQTRKRAIVLISKNHEWEMPEKEEQITVREAIEYLPTLESEGISDIKYHNAKKHKEEHILCLKHTPTGKTALNNEVYYPKKDGRKVRGYQTTYKRIEWDKPSPTITMCNGAVSSQNNVHPGRKLDDGTYSDARVLTLLELFILMGLPKDPGFPDGFSDNQIRHILGEAVPPILIKRIVGQIMDTTIVRKKKSRTKSPAQLGLFGN